MDKEEVEMGKYDDEIKSIAGRVDKEELKALWSIANELAKINKFLDGIGIDEKKFDKLLRHWLGG